MKLAYIFEQFPCPSETFAIREIECLRRSGIEITVFCIRRGDPIANTRVRIIEKPKWLSWRYLASIFFLVICRWTRLPHLAAFCWQIGVQSPRHAMRLVLDLPAVSEFARQMKTHGIGHVHGYWLGRPARLAVAVSVLTGATTSLSAHARDIFTETQAVDVLAHRAKFISVCTLQGLLHLQRILGLACYAKLRLVRHGLLPEENGNVDKLSLHSHCAHRVAAIGRLVEKKGFSVLLHAFKLVRARHDSAKLAIVGDGPMQETLKMLVLELGLDEHVILSGWLPHGDALDAVHGASVLAVPSIIASDGDRDGVPNVILEAFACGTPVVASRLAAIGEAIEHKKNGLLVEPGDPEDLAAAICRILEDGQLAECLVRGGHQVLAERFDAVANSEVLEALFREVIERHAE